MNSATTPTAELPNAFVEHPEITTQATRGNPWFDDGNIILEVEATQYKIYGGILALHSAIFQDMMAIPGPAISDASATVDGCPVVKLADRMSDWEHVLAALFERKYATGAQVDPLPLDIVGAFLRLGKKYEITTLYEDAVGRLAYEIPSSFADRARCNPGERTRIQIKSLADYFVIVSLAREHDLFSILPCALYCCVHHCVQGGDWEVMKTFLRGAARDDGSVVELSYADKEVCLLGWEKIIKLQGGLYQWALTTEISVRCSSPDACTTARALHRPSSSNSRPSCDLFSPWKASWAKELCKGCSKTAERSYARASLDAWNELPSAFELQSWQVLFLNQD